MARFDYRDKDAPPVTPQGAHNRLRAMIQQQPQIPYLLPYLVFLLVMLPSMFKNLAGIDWEKLWTDWNPLLYTLKTVLAAIALWFFWPWYTRIRWSKLHWGVLAGLFGTLLWIGTELLCQKLHIAAPDPSSAYNPDNALPIAWQKTLFLCIRIAGPTLVVPVMEELFFRDFLMRTLIAGASFEDVPVGAFSWVSLLGMCAFFGINHGLNFFFPGFFYGLLMGILLIRTKSLGACIVAHGTTNLTLYLFVLYMGDATSRGGINWWQFM